MSIQRHFDFSSAQNSAQNSQSNKYPLQRCTSQQNIILQKNTKITQHDSNASAAKRERIVFQPENGEQKTVLLESTKSNKHNPPYFVSQQNIVLLENIKPDKDNS